MPKPKRLAKDSRKHLATGDSPPAPLCSASAPTYSPRQGCVVKVMKYRKREQHATHHCHQHSWTSWHRHGHQCTRLHKLHRNIICHCRNDKGLRRHFIRRERLCRKSATDCGGSRTRSSPPLKTLSTSKTLKNNLQRATGCHRLPQTAT